MTFPTPPPLPQANGVVQPAPRLILQQEYAPPRTHGGGFTPEDPIHFFANGVLGISVSQVVNGVYTMLDGRDDRMVSFKGASATCRVQVGNITSQTSIPSTTFLLVHRARSV